MQVTEFKYNSLSEASRMIVQQRTSEIKTLIRKTASDIIEIGHKLIEVKEELPHGKFGNWLETEFGWSWKTANRFMNVADKFDTVTNLDAFAHKALYMLSESSTPEPARQEAIERAENGESITYTSAKEIKKRHSVNEHIELTEKQEEIYQLLVEQDQNKPDPKPIAERRAEQAIWLLQQIPEDDPDRNYWLLEVAGWIDENVTVKTPT